MKEVRGQKLEVRKYALRAVLCALLFALCALPALAQSCGQPGGVCFPDAVDTEDVLFRTANGSTTTLTATLGSSATTATVVSTSKFPSSGALQVDNELLYYTAKTSTTFTGLIRAMEGTTAASHAVSATARSPILASQHNAVASSLYHAELKLGSGNSTPALNKFLVGTAPGTSGWRNMTAADVTTALNGTWSGTWSNTGSTTIGCDSDSDSSGVCAIQTKGVMRFQVNNGGSSQFTGRVGLGFAAPADASLEYGSPSTANKYVKIHAISNASGDFNMGMYASSWNGNPRKLQSIYWGMNMSNVDGAEHAGDTAFGYSIEHYWDDAVTGCIEDEAHLTWTAEDGTHYRPYTWNLCRATKNIQLWQRASTFLWNTRDDAAVISLDTVNYRQRYYGLVTQHLINDVAIDQQASNSGGAYSGALFPIAYIDSTDHLNLGGTPGVAAAVPTRAHQMLVAPYDNWPLPFAPDARLEVTSFGSHQTTLRVHAGDDGADVLSKNIVEVMDGYQRPLLEISPKGRLRVDGAYDIKSSSLWSLTPGYYFNGTKVIGARTTGWGAPTGTATRTTFVTSTATTEDVAQRLKALIDDLTTHGLIGP